MVFGILEGVNKKGGLVIAFRDTWVYGIARPGIPKSKF
jgi:hypothetical protein